MTHSLSTLAGLGLAVALGGSAQAHDDYARPYPARAQCDITAVKTPGGILLRPVAFARGPVNGSYDLSIRTASRSGQSDISQGGDFATSGRETQDLGTVFLGRAPGGVATARMSLSWAGGQSTCERRFRL